MAETHELRLKINAAAARAGAREFVSAIRSIQTAVEMLDRKSMVAFDGINTRSRTAGGGLNALVAHYNSARSANDKFAASVSKANTALQRQISLANQARSAASVAGGARGGGAGAGQAADQQVSMQNRIRRAVDDSKLSVERLNVALMKVGGFQSINEVSAAYRRFQKEIGNAATTTQQLDSAKTRLNSSLKAAQTSLVTLTAKAQDNARAERAAAAAAREKGNAERSAASAAREQASAAKLQAAEINKAANAQLAAASAMRQAEQETARLTNRLRAVGDTRGITALNQALISMKGNLTTAGTSTLQVRQAMAQFSEATNRARLSITRADGAKQSAARAAARLAVEERAAANAARQLEANMRSAGGAANASSRAFRNATGNLRGLENAFSATFQAGSAFRAMLGSITLGAFTKGVFHAGDALDQFRITMEVASGSSEAAANDLVFINDIAARLGTNLEASRDAFSKFAVASDIAGVSGTQTREIFESVATAMSVLGRGTEDQRLAFLALEQMMSKGVISAEELRRQLGERLPGAVSMMAEAVGVSVGELQKMLKAGELMSNEVLPKFADVLNRRFGSQLDRTFNRAGSNLGRLQVEFQRFFEAIAESGFLDELAIQFRDLTSAMRSEEVQDAARRIGEGFAEAAELFGKASLFIINNIEEIGRVATVIIGTLVVRQFALLAQSAAMGVQGMLAAVASFTALRTGATAAATSMGGYNAAAVTATASTTALGTGALTTATRLTRVGTAVAGIGRIFGALAGPVGLVFSALTLVPMALDMIGESAETAAFDYGDAMRHMETTTFRFLDRAREASELGIGEAIQVQADEILEAQQLLAQFRADAGAGAEIDSSFGAILGGGVSESVREILNTMRELNVELRDPSVSLDRALEITEEIKSQFLAIRNAVPEDQIRRLEDALLPGAQLVRAIVEDMEALNGVTAGQAEALVDANAQYELANNNVRAIREGLDAVGTAVVSEDVRTLMGSETRFASLGEAVSELGRALGSIPTVNPALVDSVDRLGAELDDGTITAAQFRDEFDALQPSIAATLSEAERLNPAFQGFGQEANFAAQEVDGMSSALVAAESSAYNAEQAAYAAADAAYNAADAGHAGAAGMRDLANAFAAIGGAGNAAAAAIGAEIAKVERQIELRSADFVTRQVGQALDRQSTLIETQRANIEGAFSAAMDAANGSGDRGILTAAAEADRAAALAQLDDGIATYEERVRTLATTPLNNEGRPTTSRSRGGGGGGRRSGSGSGSTSRDRETAAQATERLTKAVEALTKGLNSSLESLEAENNALILLSSGYTTSERAARLLGEAQQQGLNIFDEQTTAMLRQIEAAEMLNEALTRLANDPVNDWMNSVPTWREAGQQIETGVLNHLSDAISNFIKTGEFSFEALGDAILGTVADIIADKAVKELANLLGGNTTGSGEGGFGLGGMLSNLFGNGGSRGDDPDPFASGFGGGDQSAAMQSAMAQGGQQAAQAIQQAMLQAGQQVGQQITTGGSQAASQMGTSVQTAGTSAGAQMSTQTMTGGTIAGTQMMTQTQTGGTIAAQQMQQGIMAGGSAAAQQMAAASSGGGGGFGGGFGGGLGGILLGAGIGLLGSIFSKKKSTPSGPSEPETPVGIRQFSEGTANTSGIPAILHPNEAVIPLSGGRKVPVEMNDDMAGGRGGKTLVQNFNIQTPDADSFRKSQKQMAADAASSGRKALGDNG